MYKLIFLSFFGFSISNIAFCQSLDKIDSIVYSTYEHLENYRIYVTPKIVKYFGINHKKNSKGEIKSSKGFTEKTTMQEKEWNQLITQIVDLPFDSMNQDINYVSHEIGTFMYLFCSDSLIKEVRFYPKYTKVSALINIHSQFINLTKKSECEYWDTSIEPINLDFIIESDSLKIIKEFQGNKQIVAFVKEKEKLQELYDLLIDNEVINPFGKKDKSQSRINEKNYTFVFYKNKEKVKISYFSSNFFKVNSLQWIKVKKEKLKLLNLT